MVEIRALTTITEADLGRLVVGYTTETQYIVEHRQDVDRVVFDLRLERLPVPRTVRFDYTDGETVERYQQVVKAGDSFGAYIDDALTGIAIAEHQQWNNILWVWEFHVAPPVRGIGVGRGLMQTMFDHSRTKGIRAVVCETQTRNTPAIAFYQRMGFMLEGIDVSYYSNDDMQKQDVAVFMKKRL